MNKEERKKWQEYLERREEALKSCLRETNLKKADLEEEIRRVQELKEKNKEEDLSEEYNIGNLVIRLRMEDKIKEAKK